MTATKIKIVLFVLALTACSHLQQKPELSKNPTIFQHGSVSIAVETILPETYHTSHNDQYPVIFVLDGYWNQNFVEQIYNALRFDNMIPEAIIVTIGYPAEIQDYETQRMWDLTLVRDAGFKAGGNAEDLLKILADDVLPFMKNHYRIDKNRTVLIGHSLAGLFTLYSLYEKSNVFTHYAAISPSALWADYALSKLDSQFAAASNTLTGNVYLTYETDEYRPYVDALDNYVEQIKKRNYQGLNLTTAVVDGMGHVSMKSEGYARGLAWAFADIRPKDPSEFEKKNLKALENIE